MHGHGANFGTAVSEAIKISLLCNDGYFNRHLGDDNYGHGHIGRVCRVGASDAWDVRDAVLVNVKFFAKCHTVLR